MRAAGVLLCGLLTMALGGCAPAPTGYEPRYSERPARAAAPEYVLAVHPLHNPKRLFEVYQPLIDHLNARIPGLRLRLEASSSYAAFEGKLARGQVDLALPNPYQTLKARSQGYHVFSKMGDDESFRGVILVRRDSGIERPRDLEGRSISFPARTALAATLLPQWFLHENGVDVQGRLDIRYVGTQESSIMNVVLGQTAAGATWTGPWRAFQAEQPALAAQVVAKWETQSLLNNSLMAHERVPVRTVDAIRAELVSLHKEAAGRAILQRMQLSRFEPANDATYEPVQDFIDRFEREVRPVEAPQ